MALNTIGSHQSAHILTDRFFEYLKPDDEESHKIMMTFSSDNFSYLFQKGLIKHCLYLWKHADEMQRVNIRNEIYQIKEMTIYLKDQHCFNTFSWFYGVCNREEQSMLLARCRLFDTSYPPETQYWLWQASKKSKPISDADMFSHLLQHARLDDAKAIYHTIPTEYRFAARMKFFAIDFLTALENSRLDLCEWFWEISSATERAQIISRFSIRNYLANSKVKKLIENIHLRNDLTEASRVRERLALKDQLLNSSRHVYQWLYQHAETNEQRSMLMKKDGYTEFTHALQFNDVNTCQQLWQNCTHSAQANILQCNIITFPKLLSTGKLESAQWLWKKADDAQKSALLKQVNLYQVSTLNKRGHHAVSRWLSKLLHLTEAHTNAHPTFFASTTRHERTADIKHHRTKSL